MNRKMVNWSNVYYDRKERKGSRRSNPELRSYFSPKKAEESKFTLPLTFIIGEKDWSMPSKDVPTNKLSKETARSCMMHRRMDGTSAND